MWKKNPLSSDKHPIILFDGFCALCNWAVNFIIHYDKERIFRYAPLQSHVGQELANTFGGIPQNIDSIILIAEGKLYVKASAIRYILNNITNLYILYLTSLLLPNFLLNYIYNMIARNRYKWFGKYSYCRLPNEKDESLFL